jgi:hypothetical protein
MLFLVVDSQLKMVFRTVFNGINVIVAAVSFQMLNALTKRLIFNRRFYVAAMPASIHCSP